MKNPGEPVSNGLTKTAAADLGLQEGLPVGTSIIDAHAGGLGERKLNCYFGVKYQTKPIDFIIILDTSKAHGLLKTCHSCVITLKYY